MSEMQSLYASTPFTAVSLWHSCLPSQSSNCLFRAGGMASYHLHSRSSMEIAVGWDCNVSDAANALVMLLSTHRRRRHYLFLLAQEWPRTMRQ
ncbi:hypothetical protein IG631_24160 [Alternaria alternata]|nr:hypothetical protein IG631_24160 [Alternaria alternata]